MAKEGFFTMQTSLNILKNLFKEEHINFDKQYDEFTLKYKGFCLWIYAYKEDGGDISENLIRSTNSRVKYKEHNFKIFNVPEIIKKGDIIIESSKFGHYAGELLIAKTEMKNTGKSNVVGKIADEEIFLIDYIKPWQKFSFVKK